MLSNCICSVDESKSVQPIGANPKRMDPTDLKFERMDELRIRLGFRKKGTAGLSVGNQCAPRDISYAFFISCLTSPSSLPDSL
jgi:hypothetical protein